jgi:hypothetical protein
VNVDVAMRELREIALDVADLLPPLGFRRPVNELLALLFVDVRFLQE